MTENESETAAQRLSHALRGGDASARLQAALAAGTHPNPAFIAVLVERCAVEPDFFVRDMLTWALTRHEPAQTFEAVVAELRSPFPQARSQALHTLSKLADPAGWAHITSELLHDDEVEVARAAWRTASGLVPPSEAAVLADALVAELGRGHREAQRSLSRAFATIGSAAEDAVRTASEASDANVSTHAIATLRIMADPEEGFDAAIDEAKRIVAVRAAPKIAE